MEELRSLRKADEQKIQTLKKEKLVLLTKLDQEKQVGTVSFLACAEHFTFVFLLFKVFVFLLK